jgi:Sortase and related acyltransferases
LPGQGVGKKLIEEALAEARKFSLLETMLVSVLGENLPMLRLLAKFGFLEYGREPKGIKLADRYLDRLMLWRPVSADYVYH